MRRLDIMGVGVTSPTGSAMVVNRPVPSKTTHQLSARELWKAGGGRLADLQTALQVSDPAPWAPSLRRLLEEGIYIHKGVHGEDDIEVYFDAFAQHAKGCECWQVWDDDDGDRMGRRAPRLRVVR